MHLYVNLFASKQGRVKFLQSRRRHRRQMLQYMEPRNARALVHRLASPRLLAGLHTHTGYKVFSFFLT